MSSTFGFNLEAGTVRRDYWLGHVRLSAETFELLPDPGQHFLYGPTFQPHPKPKTAPFDQL
jgi:hypothetical protein